MGPEVLDRRTLNRTLLSRQGLLARSSTTVPDVLDRLVGQQAQEPFDPYFGLWSRIDGFAADDLATLLSDGLVVRAQLLRATIHLVTVADYHLLCPVLLDVRARTVGSTVFAKNTAHIDRDRVLEAGRALLTEAPRTRAELGRLLAIHFPDTEPTSLAQIATYLLPVIQLPPRAVWGRTGQATWGLLDPPPADPGEIERRRVDLAVRYLAAFGPAAVKDMRAWSGLAGLASTVSRARERLLTYRDEQGTELLDHPDGEIVDGDVAVPPRFLPEYDNALLGHADRSRVFVEGVMPPGWAGNLLVDGFYAGWWKIDRKQRHLDVTLQTTITARQHGEVAAEAERVAVFALDGATPSRISIVPAS